MSIELTTLKDIEDVIENYETFTAYVLDQDTHIENVTVDLIGRLYGLQDDSDIEDLSTDYLINIIESILDLHRAYMRRNQL
jgi:hypothetical protein